MSATTCGWTEYASYVSNSANKVKLRYVPPSGTSRWRVVVAATVPASEATSGVRKLKVKR